MPHSPKRIERLWCAFGTALLGRGVEKANTPDLRTFGDEGAGVNPDGADDRPDCTDDVDACDARVILVEVLTRWSS